jgi:DNA polymerase-3 subunit epsilon
VEPAASPPLHALSFAAIDFETANYRADSACAVGIVVVRNGEITARIEQLLRPPTSDFVFTHIHGLDWDDVRTAPTFGDYWPDLRRQIDDVSFFAAHNAPFDRGVLAACCSTFEVPPLARPFACTVQIARSIWNIRPTKLPDVCRHLGIPLRHHDAGADAFACANIVLAALQAGWQPPVRQR